MEQLVIITVNEKATVIEFDSGKVIVIVIDKGSCAIKAIKDVLFELDVEVIER